MASENSPLRMRPRGLGESRGGILAIGRDELGKSREQACLRQESPSIPSMRASPRLVQIAERSAPFARVRSVAPKPVIALRCHAHAQLTATSPAAMRRGGKLACERGAPSHKLRKG